MSSPRRYNATVMARRSTAWLEAKVAELRAAVAKDTRRKSREAYYAAMGREQRLRMLQVYSAALADRLAGILPDDSVKRKQAR